MTSILHPIDFDAKLKSLGVSGPTLELSYQDTEVARFVKRATMHQLPPSVFQVTGRMFPWFVPEEYWDTPMWVHWLGDGYDHLFDELAHVYPVANLHYSTDLLKCREMLCWNTSSTAFCASGKTGGLGDTVYSAENGDVLSVFISPGRFMFNLLQVSERLRYNLNMMSCDTGYLYEPNEQFSDEERSAALVGSVLFGNEPKVDSRGREIVLLKRRALPEDWGV
ncbi:hypothetical protein [uncultured Massilia sp.]|uniref:hypothetical protein n=1 Tax=uncultured Massilia sp. TaxID=169973 RepID=UPI0025825695|nr:hypothetical protein [uncultured Massilia sp.]